MKRLAAAALLTAGAALPGQVMAADDTHMRAGAAIYEDNCQACHEPDGKGQAGIFPPLAGNPLVAKGSAEMLARGVLAGAQAVQTKAAPTGAVMPSFGWRLTDQEIADVLTYVRVNWNNASAVSASTVASVRRGLRRRP